MDNPFTTILERLDKIEHKIDSFAQTSAPVELPDRMNFEEAREHLNISKSLLYKLTSTSQIPHRTFQGKRKGRLIFSRRELEAWMKESTFNVHPEKMAADQMAKSARRKK